MYDSIKYVLYDSSKYVVFMYCIFIFVLHVLCFKYCFYMFILHINIYIINTTLVLYLHCKFFFVLHLYSFVAFCGSEFTVVCVAYFCWTITGELSDIKVFLFLSLLHHGNSGLF